MSVVGEGVGPSSDVVGGGGAPGLKYGGAVPSDLSHDACDVTNPFPM